MKGHMKFTNLTKDIERKIADHYAANSIQDKMMRKQEAKKLLKTLAKHCITMLE